MSANPPQSHPISVHDMLRFPNPGSSIDNFVGVYDAAFKRLHGRTVDIDANGMAVVTAGLIKSSGHIVRKP